MSTVDFDGILVVGGGLSGCSTAYHLTLAKQKVLSKSWGSADAEVTMKRAPGTETTYKLGVSGTAGVGPVKMVVTQPPRPLTDFAHEHGEQGTRLYLHMSSKGVELEKSLAQRFAPNSVHSHGSLCVAFPNHEKDMETDYYTYRKLGIKVELYNAEQVAKHHGKEAGFTRGLFFPDDAIIHSADYARALLKVAQATGLLTVRENCPRVVRADDASAAGAIVVLANGEKIRARTVVLATGGLFLPDDLKGILRPCWSYFTYLKASQNSFPQPLPHSPNFFTFDFSHDWCVTDGEVRISGEDHFSGMKPPRWKERCAALESWLRARYPKLQTPVQRLHYGIYSETPDALPILGRRDPASNVVYLLGCNAWGQSILSYCASLIPGILGLKKLESTDQQLCDFISLARFTARGKL